MNKTHIIRWPDTACQALLYGARVDYLPGKRVGFDQVRLASGTGMVTWYSTTQYQGHRHTPNLPLLLPGQSYLVHLYAESQPASSLELRFDYYDRFGDLLYSEGVHEGSPIVTYPEEAYSYQVVLVNTGATGFIFEAFTLQAWQEEEEVEDLSEDEVEVLLNPSEEGETLRIILEEPSPYFTHRVSARALEGISDVLWVSNHHLHGGAYLTQSIYDQLNEEIEVLKRINYVSQIDLISYGPIGNLAVRYWARHQRGIQGWVTDDWYSLEEYQAILGQVAGELVLDNLEELLWLPLATNIHTYGTSQPEMSTNFRRITQLEERLQDYRRTIEKEEGHV